MSIVGLIYTSTYAANTLNSDNEIITISTTNSESVNAAYYPLDYSGDGNIVLFMSSATNLPNASGNLGLYTYNIKSNTTARIDVSASGVAANAGKFGSSHISESGRYVTFGSIATNLIDGTTSYEGMFYKKDTQANTITQFAGAYSNGANQNWDRNLAVSNDGQFSLIASRFKPTGSATYYNYKIALGKDTSGTYNWTQVAKDSQGGMGSNGATAVAGGLSCDGAFAAYQFDTVVQLADFRSGTITKISVGGNQSTSPIISCNGRYILYATLNQPNITPAPPVGTYPQLHLARYDRITGERMYVDTNSTGSFSIGADPGGTGTGAIENAFSASVADTGDVVFNYNGSTYIKHLSDGSGTLEPIAKKVNGTYYSGVSSGTITSNGRYAFFSTDPYNLGLTTSTSTTQLIRTKTNL